jgi:arylsulfatase A-like enzyme
LPRRSSHCAAAVAAVAAAFLFAPADPGAGAAMAGPPLQPNVLLIIADDIGVDKVESYAADVDSGYADRAEYLPQTPVLSDMAAAGLRFTDAWATPTCTPTRAATYTGNYPFRTGLGGPLPETASWRLEADEFTTSGTIASDRGYATAMFGKWHLGNNGTPDDFESGDWEDNLNVIVDHTLHPQSHGFHTFKGTLHGTLDSGGTGGYTDWLMHRGSYCEGCDPEHTSSAKAESRYATIVTTMEAWKWANHQTEPWYMVVSYHAPHTPLEMPPETCTYSDAWDETEDKAVYAAMVECLDLQIGQLFDNLHDLDNTVVIFVGDNGTEHFYAEDIFADRRGKTTVYESGVRVPLMITHGAALEEARAASAVAAAGAGDTGVDAGDTGGAEEALVLSRTTARLVEPLTASPGRTINAPVQVTDLFSTVVDLVGGDDSTGPDGVSLLPLMQETSAEVHDWIYTETFSETHGQLAVREGDWKLLAWAVEDDGGGLCFSAYELFNLSLDRLEETDLFDSEPEVAASLLAHVAELAASDSDAWINAPDCDAGAGGDTGTDTGTDTGE